MTGARGGRFVGDRPVEILSPSTRLIDRNLKKVRFEEAGCASFWVVDPLEPRLTAWELVDGTYVEVAALSGDESWTASAPYAVTISPARLVDRPVSTDG